MHSSCVYVSRLNKPVLSGGACLQVYRDAAPSPDHKKSGAVAAGRVLSIAVHPTIPDLFVTACSDGAVALYALKQAAPLCTWIVPEDIVCGVWPVGWSAKLLAVQRSGLVSVMSALEGSSDVVAHIEVPVSSAVQCAACADASWDGPFMVLGLSNGSTVCHRLIGEQTDANDAAMRARWAWVLD
jgi:hypothetical protein